MTAGGAAGITSIAQELGTETGLVAVLQYLRVVLVMMSLPIAVLWIFAEPVYISTLPTQTPGNWPGSLLLLVLGGLSAPIAKRLHLAAPYLLGPLLVTLILTATGYNPTPALPSVLLYLAYLFIGWQAGLQLSITRLPGYRFLLPRALLLIVFLNLLCALLGLALAHLAGVSDLDGFLATAPGALYAAIAVSMAAHGNVLFVLGVHLLRLLLMLLIVPSLVQYLRYRDQRMHR